MRAHISSAFQLNPPASNIPLNHPHSSSCAKRWRRRKEMLKVSSRYHSLFFSLPFIPHPIIPHLVWSLSKYLADPVTPLSLCIQNPESSTFVSLYHGLFPGALRRGSVDDLSNCTLVITSLPYNLQVVSILVTVSNSLCELPMIWALGLFFFPPFFLTHSLFPPWSLNLSPNGLLSGS